jgi:two-component system NtrC family sensor kinase
LLVLAVGYYYFTSSLQQDSWARLWRIAQDHQRVIEMFLDERRSDLEFIAKTTNFDYLKNPNNLKAVFDHLRAKSAAYVDLGVFDSQGMHVAYQGPFQLAGRVYSDAEWYHQVREQGYFISDVFLGVRKVPHFIIAIAVPNGDQFWVLRATIDTLFFTDFVERVRMGKTGEAYILNDARVFQTERRSGGGLLEKDTDSWPQDGRNGMRSFSAVDADGDQYLYVTTWLQDKDWQLVVRQERSDAFSALNMASLLVVVIAVVGGVGIVTVAFLLTGNIIGRMKRADEEKSQLNQQLIVASRLAEIGEMSAGFAHEINNPLQIIRAEQTLISTILDELFEAKLLQRSEDVDDLLDSVDQIKTQVDRCGNITQSILKFARQKEPSPQVLDLKKFVPEVVSMVTKKAQVNGIELVQDMGPNPAQVNADPGQLQQVVLNLLNNAFDAATELHGVQDGQVRVSLEAGDQDIRLNVTDNGAGISPENLERIFTPFFTTKPVGKGTGLGLPVCFGIVDKMGGTIEVSSQPGRGATFSVVLPLVGRQPGSGDESGSQAGAAVSA